MISYSDRFEVHDIASSPSSHDSDDDIVEDMDVTNGHSMSEGMESPMVPTASTVALDRSVLRPLPLSSIKSANLDEHKHRKRGRLCHDQPLENTLIFQLLFQTVPVNTLDLD